MVPAKSLIAANQSLSRLGILSCFGLISGVTTRVLFLQTHFAQAGLVSTSVFGSR